MDSVLQALGFQDLEHAKDWICQNGQGQVIAVAPNPSSPSSATPTERISDLQQQLKLSQLELEKKTKSIAHLRGFLADANVRIEQLEDQQRDASLGFRRFGYDEQKTHGASLMAELEYTRTDAETTKVELDLLKSEVLVLREQLTEKEAPFPAISPGRLPDTQLHHANTDSEVPNYRPEECPTGALRSTATSYEALEVVNAHLRSKYHILSSTLAQERATFEDERMRWRRFKRRFAARLLAQSTSNSAQQMIEGAESSRSASINRAKSRPLQLGLNSPKSCPDSPHQDACVGEDLSSAKRKMASPLISLDLNRRHDHAQPSTARPAQCLSPPPEVLCDQARLAVPNQETASPLITHKKADKIVFTSAAPHTTQLGMSFATRLRLSQQLQATRLAENETVRLSSVTLQSPSSGGPSSTLDEEENMPSPQPYQPPSTLEALLGIPEKSFNEPANRDYGYRRQPTSVSLPDSQRQNAQIERLSSPLAASSNVVQAMHSQVNSLGKQSSSSLRDRSASPTILRDHVEWNGILSVHANDSDAELSKRKSTNTSSRSMAPEFRSTQASGLKSIVTPHQKEPADVESRTASRSLIPVVNRLKASDLSVNKNPLDKSTPLLLSKAALANIATPPSALPAHKWIRYSDRQARMGKSVWRELSADLSPPSTSKIGVNTSLRKKYGRQQMETSDIQDCEQSPKRTKGHDSCHKAAATAPRLREEEQESLMGKKQHASPRTSKVNTQLTSPKLSRRRSRGRSVSRSPRSRVLATASKAQYPLVCRDLGLPPTPYAPRQIRHSSPISPARLQQAQLLPDTPDQKHKTKHKVKAAEEGSTARKRRRKSRRESDEPVPVEEYPGQNFMRGVHKKRKEDLERSIKKGQQDTNIGPKPSTSEASRALMSRFEIDPEGNFGVGHVFNEVARGKEVRKQMHGADCECCSGYYEQVAKDFNQPLKEVQKQMAQHKNEISRHRHFNPPPATPPYYWQMGFPDTQQVEIINREADDKKRRKLAMVEAQARDGIGPYKFRDDHAS